MWRRAEPRFSLHYAIEYDAVELYNANNGSGIDFRRPRYITEGDRVNEPIWINGVYECRGVAAWLRCVAAYGAQDPVSPSDIPHLEARASESARRLDAEYLDAEYRFVQGQRNRNNMISSGMSSEPSGPPRPDVCAELPALYALQLDAFLSICPSVRPWLRLIAARALAYGRLNGAENVQAYRDYLGGHKRCVWDRGNGPVPRYFPYSDDTDCVNYIPLEEWDLITPGQRITPIPIPYGPSPIALKRIFKMATSVRTLACKLSVAQLYIDRDVDCDALPRLDKLTTSDTQSAGLWPLSARTITRVREYFCTSCRIMPELYRMIHGENVFGNLERIKRCCDDTYVYADRTMLDTLLPDRVDESLLRERCSSTLANNDPLVRAFGFVQTLTESENAALEMLGGPLPVEAFSGSPIIVRTIRRSRHGALLLLEWLRTAADPPLT